MSMDGFYLLRPWWLLACIPLFILLFLLWRKRMNLDGWSEICDPHLLEHVTQQVGEARYLSLLSPLLFSLCCMIMALSGPAWHRLPVVTYKSMQARMIVLDMSSQMLATDLTPDRLSRAKFKLRDLFMQKDVGQLGLIVYTSEPFVVSPLTDDAQTITALLSALTPDIMPVGGHQLDGALREAAKMIEQAGYQQGQILVLTAHSPSPDSISTAAALAQKGIDSSIMPVMATSDINPLFARFAQAGEGELIPYRSDSSDLVQWINSTDHKQFAKNHEDEIPLWQDEGLWFLVPALCFLLPVFQRAWLQRVSS